MLGSLTVLRFYIVKCCSYSAVSHEWLGNCFMSLKWWKTLKYFPKKKKKKLNKTTQKVQFQTIDSFSLPWQNVSCQLFWDGTCMVSSSTHLFKTVNDELKTKGLILTALMYLFWLASRVHIFILHDSSSWLWYSQEEICDIMTVVTPHVCNQNGHILNL